MPDEVLCGSSKDLEMHKIYLTMHIYADILYITTRAADAAVSQKQRYRPRKPCANHLRRKIE